MSFTLPRDLMAEMRVEEPAVVAAVERLLEASAFEPTHDVGVQPVFTVAAGEFEHEFLDVMNVLEAKHLTRRVRA